MLPAKPALHTLQLNVPILEQLRIEEALLRVDTRNWCLINEGTNPTIVMGISGKPEQLINQLHLASNPIPVIKRFSGGGTVVVDHQTFFTTFICNSDSLNVPCTPKDIFSWSERFFQPVFHGIGFKLLENDYVIGERKFGGNAQYIRKERWLHHTSFLWDYHPSNMDYLLMPSKKPQYRQERSHHDFLCRLRDYLPSREHLKARFQAVLEQQFEVHAHSLESIQSILNTPHRQATAIISDLKKEGNSRDMNTSF